MRASSPTAATWRALARRRVGVVLALVASTACIAIRPPAKDPMTWPFPPDKPRIKFVRSFGSEDDLRTGFGMTLKRILIPSDPGLVLMGPTYVSLTPDEKRLVVACGSSARVIEIDLEKGTFRMLAAREGTRPLKPYAAVMDDAENLYVSDSAQKLVWVYDPSGKVLRQIGKGLLTRPTGLAIDRRRQLLYVVNADTPKSEFHAIEVFSLKGDHIRRMGKQGSAGGEFFLPSHATVDREGKLYVSDVLNARVQIFGPEGELLAMVGQSGIGATGLFQKVKGVAVDAFGNLHAADSATSNLQIFNSRQQPLMSYGGSGRTAEFLLQMPTGLAIDSRNNIFVADYAANRIVQYQLFDTSAPDSTESPPPQQQKSEPPQKGPDSNPGEKPQAG